MTTSLTNVALGAIYYRPHPKDGVGTVFAGVCLSTGAGGGAGIPVPGSFPGLWSGPFREVPQSQVLSQVSGPSSFLVGGTQVPSSFPGLFPWGGYPSPGLELPQS